MAKYPFLSEGWTQAAKALREEAGDAGSVVPGSVKMNLVITEVPFGDGNIDAHLDTTAGQLDMDLGHLENPEVKVTLERVWLENSYHVATLDFDQELIESRIVEFFKSIFGIA